jgi:hypothetical protein
MDTERDGRAVGGWMDGCIDIWMDGKMDEWKDG